MQKTAGTYHEIQYFRQWWLIALIILIPIVFLYGTIRQLLLGIPWGNNPMSDTGLMLSLAAFILFGIWFIFFLRLEMLVDEKGIHYRFHGLHIKRYHLQWSEIKSIDARSYKPIREYGGWGIRYGFHGKAYNVSGNQGIQVETHGGARLLFGTQNPTEFMQVVQRYHQP